MFKLDVTAVAVALLMSAQVPAFAAQEKKAEGQSSLKVEEVSGQKNQVKSGDQDMDEVITNKKMRAEAGSKSKHSLNTAIAYSGSTLQKPFADMRPNLRGRADQTTVANLGGTVAYKYSATKTASMKLGVGVRWITPFGGSDVPDQYSGKKNDFDNPYVNYQKVYSWGPRIQSVLTAGPTFYTHENLRANGYATNWGISQNNALEIGHSGFSVGLLLGASAYTFDKFKTANKARQQDYEFGVYPFMEYVINDTFNLRTIVGLWTYSHEKIEDRFWTFSKDTIYESVGVGISVTRDIFLYPNVQFVPEDIRADRTNVALSTNINVF